MAKQDQLLNNLDPKFLGTRVLVGAGIAFSLMIIFMYGDNVLHGKGWAFGFREYFPIITASVGGAIGGAFYWLMDPWRNQSGWKKILANILSLLVYVIVLWLSSVAGFAATGDWD